MKYLNIAFLLFPILLFSCSKKDVNSPVPTTSTPIIIADSSFGISGSKKVDITEFELSWEIKPPSSETFANATLQWSSSADFTQEKDSLLLSSSVSAPQVGSTLLKGLKQMTKYYARLSITHKNRYYTSPVFSWTTDTLKLLNVGFSGLPTTLYRSDTTTLYTNLQYFPNGVTSDAKIFLGSFECPVIRDNGQSIYFSVPGNIPPGKYLFQLKRNGIVANGPDSAQILPGQWTLLADNPQFQYNPFANDKGFYNYGTCHSSQKAWLVGGSLFNGLPSLGADAMNPSTIQEFDYQTQRWTVRTPVNKIYLDNPTCYYYNNSIYVLAGMQTTYSGMTGGGPGFPTRKRISKMLRLDLSTWTWNEMDSLPYGNALFNATGFELNNEWYIGMGARADSLSACCGDPLPSKKFWKYNPATNQWTTLANFPGSHQNFPSAFTIGNKGYVYYGGLDQDRKEFWSYSPQSNSWQSIALPNVGGPPIGEKFQIFGYNGKAYFLAGQKRVLFALGFGYALQPVFLEWNPTANTFKPISNMKNGDILMNLGNVGNKFFFKTNVLGYIESLPNKTFSFDIE